MKNKIKDIRKFRKARIWSNDMLRKYAGMFGGTICNVSAWRDDDKEGNKYRDYFTAKSDYIITNYGGYRGTSDFEGGG